MSSGVRYWVVGLVRGQLAELSMAAAIFAVVVESVKAGIGSDQGRVQGPDETVKPTYSES